MATCKECIHFEVCEPYTAPDESYPEVGGCYGFKNKDEFVQVVRCKDCKHYKPQNQGAHRNCTTPYCMRMVAVKVSPSAFCSYGERRATNEAD